MPVGKAVELVINSKDVIHDWWVPELGQKVDAIPGRTTTTWFKADQHREPMRASAPSSAAPGMRR